ncbi:unnamed protein product [Soboliphyme baturini]|uniref:Uncharacterized protein n=1 Tax=Soboliphyme baturini TaxID=241478 RepID=A0A183JAF7_9BILA|nr:unnamed protein product [Soboliphyme baturini]
MLNRVKEQVQHEAFSDDAVSGERIQKLAIEKIRSLPGNDRCCDCMSDKGTHRSVGCGWILLVCEVFAVKIYCFRGHLAID